MKRLIQGFGLALIGLFIGAFFDLPVLAQVVVNPGGGGGSSTVTAGTTATSGCTDTAFLRSASGVIQCGANALNDGSTVTFDNGAAAASIFIAKDNGTAVFTIADGGSVIHTGAFNSNGGGIYAYSGAGFGFAINGGATTTPLIRIETGLTPDALSFDTDTTSNSIHVSERADIGFDFQNPCTTGLGTAACTDPTLIVHSHNQDTGEFLSLAHDGKAGVLAGGNSTVLDGLIRLGGTVTLTESTATTVLTIPIPVTTGSGGFINYVVDARDATNVQIRTGNVSFAVANTSGGTETCNVFGIGPTTQAVGGNTTNPANPTEVQDGSGTGAITSGTLTYAWSVDTTGTNSCVLKLNAVSSLTQTTLQVHYTVISTGPAIVTGG